jgi:catechol 2,3-dioxygenase-like lactoylglutathione lyase family enzyme
MPLAELDHYFVRAKDLERSRRFYCEVLGFEVMPRPAFAFPGYWLGVGGKIQVHMGLDGFGGRPDFYLGTTARSARDNSGVVDHIAFRGTDPEPLWRRLAAMGVPARTRHVAEIGLLQIFAADPDGLMIEMNFAGVPLMPEWAPGDDG